MLDDKIEQAYYTAAEACKVLGMSRDNFNYWVRIGKIHKREFLGKHGKYTRKEINELAVKLESMILADLPVLEFRVAGLGDLDNEYHLAYQVFGVRANAPELRAARLAYLKHNPEMFYHLYHGGRLCAFLNLVPLTPVAMQQFRAGKRGWTFALSDIEQWTPGPHQAIIIDFVTTPVVPPEQRERYAQRLLTELALNTLPSLARRGVELTHVCAASGTQSGQRILDTAGFQVIADSGGGRLIYELDLAVSPLKMLRPYRAALAAYRAESGAAAGEAGEAGEAAADELLERVEQRAALARRVQRPAPGRHPADSALPLGLVPWRSFGELHGLWPSTLKKAIDGERLPIVRGEWKVGKAVARGALDASGRRRLWELYHDNPHFVECGDCPHLLT